MQLGFGKLVFAAVLFFCGFANAESEEPSVKVSGDVRYRYQTLKTGDDAVDPTQAVRARVGLAGKVNDETKAIVQFGTFGTGSRDPATGTPTGTKNSSSNQTLGVDGKSEKWNAGITQAQIQHESSSVEGLKVAFGKMMNPLYYAGKSPLIFDSDIYPEGMYLGYNYKLADDHALYFNFANFITQSMYNVTASPKEDMDDRYITASQVGWKGQFSDYLVIFGVGQTRFPIGTQMTLNEISFEFGGAVTEDFGWNLYAHMLTNAKQDDKNKANQYGIDLKYGKVKFGVAVARLEALSVSKDFTDSDIGGPDRSSTIAKISGELGKNLELACTNYTTKTALDPVAGAKVDQTRTQIDLVAKF